MLPQYAYFLISKHRYQPVLLTTALSARNAQSNPITNQIIGIQIIILQNNSFGQVKYAENHFINTDQFGLFNLIIGSGAIQSGNMSDIE